MTPLLWEVDIIGEDALLQGIAQLEHTFESFRVPLDRAGERMAASIGENIERGGVPDAFAPLAASTLYYTAATRKGGPLYNTGELLEEASQYEVKGDEVRAGVLNPDTELGKIAGILSSGNPAGNLPPRPFARFLDSDIDVITGYFVDYADEAVQRAFSASRF